MNSSEEQPRQQDQEQQKHKQLPLLTRINLPLIWAQLECGVRIEDLQEKRFHEASVLLNDYFIQDETLCKASKLAEEPISVESFLETVQFWLRDKTSLCAIDVDSDAMVGLLITRVVSYLEHARSFSRIRLSKGEAFHKVMDLRFYINKQIDVFEHFNVDSFFRYYAICVKPQHRGKGVGMGLMLSGISVARSLNQTVIMGIFTSERSQAMARKMGMSSLFEVNYADWLNEDEQLVFDDPGAGNYNASLMALKVPDWTHDQNKSFTLGQGLPSILTTIPFVSNEKPP